MQITRRILGTMFLMFVALPFAVLFDVLEGIGRLGNAILGVICESVSEFMK